jgi:hypothetical protein
VNVHKEAEAVVVEAAMVVEDVVAVEEEEEETAIRVVNPATCHGNVLREVVEAVVETMVEAETTDRTV